MLKRGLIMPNNTEENPWKLKTPPQTSEYDIYLDEKNGTEVIVCVAGKTIHAAIACAQSSL